MRSILTISLVIMAVSTAEAQVKLIVPGEHFGFKLESFQNGSSQVQTHVLSGEEWSALYSGNGKFQVKTERVSWDTTRNLNVQSDSIKQPLFYVQGLKDIVLSGEGTEFTWDDFQSIQPLRWTFNKTSYMILYENDPNCAHLNDHQYGIIDSHDKLKLFTQVPQEQFEKLQMNGQEIVRLYWTGDLNGDNEPDFFLGVRSHHEMPMVELIMSTKTNGREVVWEPFARFTEW